MIRSSYANLLANNLRIALERAAETDLRKIFKTARRVLNKERKQHDGIYFDISMMKCSCTWCVADRWKELSEDDAALLTFLTGEVRHHKILLELSKRRLI
ncbi:MAG: hypothetical protein Q8K86_07035 [Candidatus Nanopelagicaceae bacterium]|nr:hypothetical protein [Candidatus Nanopelagicaceae bacterium]